MTIIKSYFWIVVTFITQTKSKNYFFCYSTAAQQFINVSYMTFLTFYFAKEMKTRRILFLFSVQATKTQHCKVLRETQHWSHRVTDRGFKSEMENRDTYTEWRYSYATHIIAETKIWKHFNKSYALYMYMGSSQLYMLRHQSIVDHFLIKKKEMNKCVRMSVNANVSSWDRSPSYWQSIWELE